MIGLISFRTKETVNQDLFEMISSQIGCMYISDMHIAPYNQAAKNLMARVDCAKYPLSVLDDMASYLYGGVHSFSSAAQAQEFFQLKGVGRTQS